MEKKVFEIAEIISNHLQGCVSDIDRERLEGWLKSDSRNRELLDDLENDEQIDNDLQFIAKLDQNRAWECINARARKTSGPTRLGRHEFIWKYIAAAIAVVAISGVLWLAYTNVRLKQVANDEILSEKVRKPDPGKLTLRLGDGRIIALDNIPENTLLEDHGVKIEKQKGQLVYRGVAGVNSIGGIYNQVSVPAGKQYKVCLPDGSSVWLNSMTTLRFPVTFDSRERPVELAGEGYFEVSKMEAKPFIVQAGKTRVHVLGTHFNVMAYNNELVTKTTLIEGSVRVSQCGMALTMRPGQQAIVGRDMKLRVTDGLSALAWKDGDFRFEDDDLQSIMKQLERWYGIEVENLSELPDLHFSAVISRRSTLPQILHMLSLSSDLEFEHSGRKLRVKFERPQSNMKQ